MGKNDITGDNLISKPTNDAFESGWDLIWGKKFDIIKKCPVCGAEVMCILSNEYSLVECTICPWSALTGV